MIHVVSGPLFSTGSKPYRASAIMAVSSPKPISNVGKLLLATKIYDMRRIAHYVSCGLIVILPGPDEDHNPETAVRPSAVLRANSEGPYEQRIEAARFIEDLTAGYQDGWYSVISVHGGGAPAAMKHGYLAQLPGGVQGGTGRSPPGAQGRG